MARWGYLGAGREGEDDEEDAHSEAKRAAPVGGAGSVRAGGHRASMDWPRRSSAAGAVEIGTLAIRALAVKRGRIQRLDIEELEVGRLHVRELIVEQEQNPPQESE